MATAVAGGRAKSRRLASALADRPAVLADGRSPAPRGVGDLLIALREAGARSVSAPCCARCGKQLRTFQRRGQDWYCAPASSGAEPCAACGKVRPVSSRDRAGQPRCAKCPEADGRDPVTVIHGIITGLDPHASREVVAAAVRRSAPRPSYQQKLAWALEDRPGVADRGGPSGAVAGDPAVHRSAACRRRRRDHPPCLPGCRRVVRIDKPLDGSAGLPDLYRALAHRAVRTLRSPPRARHPRRPGPAAVRQLLHHRPGEPGDLHRLRAPPPGRTADPGRAAVLPLPGAAAADLLDLRPAHALRHLPRHRAALVPGLPAAAWLPARPAAASRRSPPAPWPARSAPAAPRRHPGPAARPAATPAIPAPASALAA